MVLGLLTSGQLISEKCALEHSGVFLGDLNGCFICFVHKGISPHNNIAAARPKPPGKTNVVSDAKTSGGPPGPVSSEVMLPFSGVRRTKIQTDLCQTSLSG